MKRIISLMIAATFLCLTLTGCGGGKPKDVSQEMYDVGIAALQVADEYIEYKIDGDKADSKLSILSDDADRIYERNKDTEYRYGDCIVMTDIDLLLSQLHIAEYKGVPSDIKEKRDDLAKYLGK